jgi:hypothetical protein
MIYTSYYEKIPDLQLNKNDVCIAISRKVPEVFEGERIQELAPSKELLLSYKCGDIDSNEYTKIFQEQVIDKFHHIDEFLELIYRELPKQVKKLGKEKYDFAYTEQINVILICYEPTGEFCHRHLLADYLKTKGIKCKEL